jgi:transposase
MRRRTVELSQEQRQDLVQVREHDERPYMRIKAGAILKVAAGETIRTVAREGLHRPYDEDTVRHWIDRYEQEGIDGLRVQAGRGRKPVFSPCAP